MHIPMQKVAKQSTTGGLVLPMYPPPFYGDGKILSGWVSNQKKRQTKKKRRRAATRKKQSIQQHPNTRSNSVKFVNKPLSNFDLLN